MSRKKGLFQEDHSRFEKLDRLIPLLGLGIAAYVAGRAAADRRAAERRLAQLDGVATELLNGTPAGVAEPEVAEHGKVRQGIGKLNRTKKFLVLAMLTGLIAYVMGGSTFATFSAQTANPNSSVASGTLTMSDQVNSGTVCNSYGAASQDNYNGACDTILALTNQAPGVTDPSGTYPGGYAKVTIKNTGSIDASLFSLFAPYVNGPLSTQVASGAMVGSGQTVTSFSVSSLEGPISTNDKLILGFGSTTQEFCAGGDVAPIATTTLNGAINNSTTAITVSSGTNFNDGDTVVIDAEAMTIVSGGGSTSWTVTRGASSTTAVSHSNSAGVRERTPSTVAIPVSGGYAVAAGTSNACPGTSGAIAAGTTFAVGARLNDSSSDTTPSNTDCYDEPTPLPPTGFTGATKGTDLNFNSITGNPFCTSALFWIQEQSVVGANTYNYCWFGRGSAFGDQGGNTEDSAGECRTPTQMALVPNVTTSAATATALNGAINNVTTAITVNSGASFSNGDTVVIDSEEMTIVSGGGTTSWTVTRAVNGTSASSHSNSAAVTKTEALSLNVGGNLNGNIKTNDQITLAENGSTETCYSTANYYIAASSNLAVTGCSGAPSTTFNSSATVKDATAFTNLNGSNPSSTISNFDTAHLATGAIFMPPLTANATDNPASTVQLAAHGDANSKDIRIFYIGVYFPSPSGTNQNFLQGLLSTFGLTFRTDQ
ncbi:MAG: hypothetical protein ACRDLM_10350 [Gaiellaceae bacterium]